MLSARVLRTVVLQFVSLDMSMRKDMGTWRTAAPHPISVSLLYQFLSCTYSLNMSDPYRVTGIMVETTLLNK
jgi:hypothetical protein